jgi:hypothetical protein
MEKKMELKLHIFSENGIPVPYFQTVEAEGKLMESVQTLTVEQRPVSEKG